MAAPKCNKEKPQLPCDHGNWVRQPHCRVFCQNMDWNKRQAGKEQHWEGKNGSWGLTHTLLHTLLMTWILPLEIFLHAKLFRLWQMHKWPLISVTFISLCCCTVNSWASNQQTFQLPVGWSQKDMRAKVQHDQHDWRFMKTALSKEPFDVWKCIQNASMFLTHISGSAPLQEQHYEIDVNKNGVRRGRFSKFTDSTFRRQSTFYHTLLLPWRNR